MLLNSTDGGSSQGHRCGLSCRKIQREVVGVTLVHDFHAESCTVEHVCPGGEDVSFIVQDGLVEVETVEVECHGADAEGGKPDADNRPCCQEEMQ